MTRREEIADLLKKEKLTAKYLAEYFNVEINEIVEDLEHVRKSVQPPEKFIIQPPKCKDCGFVFKERAKLKTPTKCPKCRSESIENAFFYIQSQKK